MKKNAVISIDPGMDGAVVLQFANDPQPFIWDTPTIKLKKGRGYDIAEMVSIIKQALNMVDVEIHIVHIAIEKVHAMPGQGVTSMFNMGKGFGIWLGIIGAFRTPYSLITPQAWKKSQLAGYPKGKDVSRLRAIQLYPKLHEELKRKKDVDRADALLIGRHVLNELIGQNT